MFDRKRIEEGIALESMITPSVRRCTKVFCIFCFYTILIVINCCLLDLPLIITHYAYFFPRLNTMFYQDYPGFFGRYILINLNYFLRRGNFECTS